MGGGASGIGSGALRAAAARPIPRSLKTFAAERATVDFEAGPLDETEATIASPPTVSKAEITRNLESVAAVVPLLSCLQE